MGKDSAVYGRLNRRLGMVILVFILIGVTSLSACIRKTDKWKEEVQLSNGRIIVVKREEVFEGSSGGGQWLTRENMFKPKDYFIWFVNPDESGKTIEWRSTRYSTMNIPEIPLILDIESGQPVLFTLVGVRARCEAYCKYVYRDGVWTEEQLPERFEVRKTNLAIKSKDAVPKYVDLATKQNINMRAQWRPLKIVGPTREVCG